MRIINWRQREGHDIKPPLHVLAESEDRLRAAKAQRLLELVLCLEAQGPAPQVGGSVFSDELWLNGRRGAPPVHVAVRMDWKDFGPVEQGLPVMHYRVRVRRAGTVLTEDARLGTSQEASKVIMQSFGIGEAPK